MHHCIGLSKKTNYLKTNLLKQIKMLRLTPNFLFQSYRDKGMQNNFNLKIFLLFFFISLLYQLKKGLYQAKIKPATSP